MTNKLNNFHDIAKSLNTHIAKHSPEVFFNMSQEQAKHFYSFYTFNALIIKEDDRTYTATLKEIPLKVTATTQYLSAKKLSVSLLELTMDYSINLKSNNYLKENIGLAPYIANALFHTGNESKLDFESLFALINFKLETDKTPKRENSDTYIPQNDFEHIYNYLLVEKDDLKTAQTLLRTASLTKKQIHMVLEFLLQRVQVL
ncbi:hypothetical protein [Bacillus cereus]|uniref:Uncharacterized protein n=1 Tax=Bacillus cereus TaxID=1396 RepID=A0A161T432_BACCE|nr:hypothetical protein [Bacillus cereus]KZD63364.1 hypothetical protein B4088_3349 [Bacillus cereus]